MSEIEIKKSNTLVEYESSIKFMQNRIKKIQDNDSDELIWFLNHDHIYTQGTSTTQNEILKLNAHALEFVIDDKKYIFKSDLPKDFKDFAKKNNLKYLKTNI